MEIITAARGPLGPAGPPVRDPDPRPGAATSPLVEAVDLRHAFGEHEALRGVSLSVRAGEVRALLGPNGAGKTTLLRVLTGLVAPRAGRAAVASLDATRNARELRALTGFVPSGDRSFYLRLSGLENLVFFGRLHGLSRREAIDRAHAVLTQVGLERAARNRVHSYSHGMEKRLSMARALLTDPKVLLVDEATHDLDLEGSQRIRDLARSVADRGNAVIWTTQRLDEIRGFADRVTLLSTGSVRFEGTVTEFMGRAEAQVYVLGLQGASPGGGVAWAELARALDGIGTVLPVVDERHLRLVLTNGAALGDAVVALAGAGANVVSCREERSEIEGAFRTLTAHEAEG